MPSGYVINDLMPCNITFKYDGEIIWAYEINDSYIPPVDVGSEFEDKNDKLDAFLGEFENKEVVVP